MAREQAESGRAARLPEMSLFSRPSSEPAPPLDAQKLVLYHYPSCFFCMRVRAEAEALGVELELRDIHSDPEHADELYSARGRLTVPVLRLAYADDAEHWYPESRDIVQWLRAHAAR